MGTFRVRPGRRHSIDASRQDESNGGLSRPIGPSEPEYGREEVVEDADDPLHVELAQRPAQNRLARPR